MVGSRERVTYEELKPDKRMALEGCERSANIPSLTGEKLPAYLYLEGGNCPSHGFSYLTYYAHGTRQEESKLLFE